MQIAPDTLVTKALRLARKLGQGGMGSVWVADHLALKVEVAVKFLSDQSLADEAAVRRFSAEAAAAAKIRSPHVVQVFDHGTADGIPYIVMELLEGEDLEARLTRGSPLRPDEVVDVVEQVGKALARAHAMGIVHRDIKPANVFLTKLGDEGEIFVKVLDFGLAKVGSEKGTGQTKTDAVFGTPAYMSPEQAEASRDVTPRSDLWSLAVVAYHALTGVLPFAADSLMGLCIAIQEAKFDPPSTKNPGLPPAVDAFFERALRHDPEERFASGPELAAAFRDAVAGAVAAPMSPPRPKRSSRIGMIAAALGLVGASVGAVAALSRTSDAPRNASTEATPIDIASPPSESTPAPDLPTPRAVEPQPIATAKAAQIRGLVVNDLYAGDSARNALAPYLGALGRCFAAPALDLRSHGVEHYAMTLTAAGAVTRVRPQTMSGRDATLDACIEGVLRAVTFGPTRTGAGGEVTVIVVYPVMP